MPDQIWSDERIAQSARDVANYYADGRDAVATMIELRAMRRSYEARIRELEAQRGDWEPVEEEKIESPIPGDNRYMIVSVINEDGDHGLTVSDVEFAGAVIMPLPDGYALCRRTSSGEPPDAQAP